MDTASGVTEIEVSAQADGSRCCRRNCKTGILMIEVSQPAPEFDLETDEGTRVSLASLRGRKVVLFFYPKDNTSG